MTALRDQTVVVLRPLYLVCRCMLRNNLGLLVLLVPALALFATVMFVGSSSGVLAPFIYPLF
jgi:hypothetical protein